MANNIFGNQANAVVAKTTKPLSEIFNSSQVSVVYEIGSTIKSWVPNRPINSCTEIVVNKGYYIVALQNIDKEVEFIPPISTIQTQGGNPDLQGSVIIN